MFETMGQQARDAAYQLAKLTTAQKNNLLISISEKLSAKQQLILDANQRDLSLAKQQGMSEALMDRLTLTPERLADIVNDVVRVAQLADPVGELLDGGMLDSGLRIERRRVPLGVVAVIYEARPNVTVDVASLCLKTGNAVILRGGKETVQTNTILRQVIQDALTQQGISEYAVQTIDNPDRQLMTQLLKLDKYVDMLIPRGGAGLHQLCREQSTIPVITGGIGVCHLYLDETMDLDVALDIIINAKKQRPSACNSLETLLIHQTQLKFFLPLLCARAEQEGIKLHADKNLKQQLGHYQSDISEVNIEQYALEWLSLDLNIKSVADMAQAVEHIRHYGTQHSDGILTRSYQAAQQFIAQVDSAAVYVNASTRFTDGGQFGLGAEVAVSTQKLHARGPMGLTALTTYKWIAWGNDTLRT